ncbi:hypothetical protein COOONC_16847 [Cooperia oncophora]
MKEKMECEDCRERCTPEGEEPLLTFKNVLCPHLRYDCDQNVMRFSIWRGILEVLQIFQDARTNVKQLWDDFILHGLTDINEVKRSFRFRGLLMYFDILKFSLGRKNVVHGLYIAWFQPNGQVEDVGMG